MAACESGEINSKRQKMERAENEDLGKAAYTWFHDTRANNVPFSGVVLKEKVLRFSKSLHLDDFRASDCWLDRWKSRHNVTLREVSGEEKSCTPEMTASWNKDSSANYSFQIWIEEHFPRMHADEFDLFIRRFHQNQCTSKTNDVQEGNSVRYV